MGLEFNFPEGLTTPIVAGTLVGVVSVNLVVRLAKAFKRDATGGSFSDIVTGSISILSNKDTVLKREQVAQSMDGYDQLFNGARKNIGSLQQDESIKQREKEYRTMVNSFYDLVTDFYEWGWGQVSGANKIFGPRCDPMNLRHCLANGPKMHFWSTALPRNSYHVLLSCVIYQC